ncbi:MAG: hypothetical protein CVU81_01470 [Euryarchaeota archaeon HGW-Euryarchaeota-1]|nr:MAG: hypothetical protein CVU81_01470 [Euryarchaeota archaeon HGW-Euryarchaeota-1]
MSKFLWNFERKNNMTIFNQQKTETLKKFELAKERNLADKDVIPLCNFINSLENFYTTSSCAGRIVIIKSEGKKEPQCFIEKWHREVLFDEVKETLVPLIDKGKKLVENFDDYLKFLVNLTNKKHRKARKQLAMLEKQIRIDLK